MYVFVDFFIIFFVLSIGFINYKKGLIKTATRVISFFISIIISLVLFKPISYFVIYNTTLDDMINSYIVNIVDSHIESNETDYILPKSINNFIDKNISFSDENESNNLSNVISLKLTYLIINIFCFIILIIITRFILLFINLMSDTFSKLPLVKQFNKVGGLLYGLIESLFFVYIILLIISLLPLSLVQNIINNTFLTLFLYNHNPFLIIFYL